MTRLIATWLTSGASGTSPPKTDHDYQNTLKLLSEQVSNRDPRTIGRSEIKLLLERWLHPNTRRGRRAHMVAFFDWAMQERLCSSNPAKQTPTSKVHTKQRRRMTEAEMLALCDAVQGTLEIRGIYLGLFAGLRNQELRGLRGEHFERNNFVHVTADIAKGVKERWVPVLPELRPVVNAIRVEVGPNEFVLPAQRWRNPPIDTERTSLAEQPMSQQALGNLVARVARNAGLHGRVTPHCLRYAFADLVGVRLRCRNCVVSAWSLRFEDDPDLSLAALDGSPAAARGRRSPLRFGGYRRATP